jgi:RNA polymerase sigma-70 factor (ECF subfamily)
MLGNLEEAEEVTQEVFLTLYRKAHTFRGEAAFSSWFYRLTFNTIVGRLRQQNRFSVCLNRLPMRLASSPELLCVKRETQHMVQQAIDALLPVDRAVVLLCDIAGFSNRDAGELLSLSVSSIKSRRHRARTQLRTLIGAALKPSPR